MYDSFMANVDGCEATLSFTVIDDQISRGLEELAGEFACDSHESIDGIADADLDPVVEAISDMIRLGEMTLLMLWVAASHETVSRPILSGELRKFLAVDVPPLTERDVYVIFELSRLALQKLGIESHIHSMNPML